MTEKELSALLALQKKQAENTALAIEAIGVIKVTMDLILERLERLEKATER